MVIGAFQFELLIHSACSLKDKRQVIRSVKDRLHREHQVSVAEIAAHETLNLAVLGLAVVSTDGRQAAHVLDTITHKLRKLHTAELGNTHREILHLDIDQTLCKGPLAPPSDSLNAISAEMLNNAAPLGAAQHKTDLHTESTAASCMPMSQGDCP